MAKIKRNTNNNVEVVNESDKSLKIWDCGSPLYDSYELACVSHLIERHLMKHPCIGGGSKRFKMYQHQSMVHGSTTTTTSKTLESRSKFSRCMGNFMFGRKKIGERVKKVKTNKRFRAIKCFM
ncbi:hypothetical protein RND81_03G219500 [Saponaria officinalis]|uniref:Uncharacterized protein n=1 Tax=Saponaria officinalis TaxID=3572 RepID=A0AAW1MAI7_SAPOF